MVRTTYWIALIVVLSAEMVSETDGMMESMLDFRYFRCVMKREWKCPDSEINFFLYTPERPFKQWIDVRKPKILDVYGWNPMRKNVLIIHGFNGTSFKSPMTFIRDAYLSRKDYNVFMVDWSPLTRFPCYLSALSNLKLAAQCTAQLYSFITHAGALARMTTCVGHSLGAHVCGMISNHLTKKQYKIVGLDPARPLVSKYGSNQFRLGRDDAHVVQVIHTNAGFLGESGQIGHADFCINGGKRQPGCHGHFMIGAGLAGSKQPSQSRLRHKAALDHVYGSMFYLFLTHLRMLQGQCPSNLLPVQINTHKITIGLHLGISRCSHFMSCCYFAASVRKSRRIVGVPCGSSCPKESGQWGIHPEGTAVKLGDDVPDHSRGMYCATLDHNEACPFD